MMTTAGADDDSVAVVAYEAQLGKLRNIDQACRTCEALFHRWDERLSAGKQLGIAGGEKRCLGFGKCFWTLIGELVRDHAGVSRHALGRVFDRTDDVVIAGAATDIAFEFVPDRITVELGLAPDHVDGRHDHAGRAETALQSVIVAERLLHRMKLAVPGKPLDRRHRAAVDLNRKQAAGFDGLAVDMNDASAALAGVAADMCAGQFQLFAQEIDEQGPFFNIRGDGRAVHRHGHRWHEQISWA